MGVSGFGEGAKGGDGQARALAVFRRGARVVELAQDFGRVVVEADQADPAGSDVVQRHLECGQVVHFPAHVHPHVADGVRPGCLEGVDDLAPALRAAQAGLPGKRDGVHRRGDAVGQQLCLGVAQGERDREIDPWPWLELALEGVAMKVDDAGQDMQTARIEAAWCPGRSADSGDEPGIDGNGGDRLGAVCA